VKLHQSWPHFIYLVRMLQRTLPAEFIAPCLPTKTTTLPSGSLTEVIQHEIDGATTPREQGFFLPLDAFTIKTGRPTAHIYRNYCRSCLVQSQLG
jgi:hypothetical protein